VTTRERLQDTRDRHERLRRTAKRFGKRIDQLRDDRADVREKARNAAEREKQLEQALEQARRERRKDRLWTRRACVDGATTWLGLTLVLATVEARTGWGGGVNSADRTDHADDCGNKLSQQELYDLYQSGQGAPANRPGTGSHEGICDDDLAPVFNQPIGSKLPHWGWGLDLSDGPGFEAGAESLGFKVVRAYPNESWHVNLTANPTRRLVELHALRMED